MVVETLKNKAIGGEFYGVEVAVEEGHVSYHVILLINKKGSITIGERFFANDFETLKEKLDTNNPSCYLIQIPMIFIGLKNLWMTIFLFLYPGNLMWITIFKILVLMGFIV